MRQVKSSEFRVTYLDLAEQVEVTVNGLPIGTWTPYGAEPDTVIVHPKVMPATGTSTVSNVAQATFTPVPKPGARRA